VSGTNVKEGEGEIKYRVDGSYFKGTFKNNMRHGEDRLYFLMEISIRESGAAI